MGSLLSLMIANVCVEKFRSAPVKQAHRFYYVNDSFFIWSYGKTEKLLVFLMHLNSVHPWIQFTLEKEEGGQLPFLDVLVVKRNDGRLGHRVYQKPTHMGQYLHTESNHHPGQKRVVMRTLIY